MKSKWTEIDIEKLAAEVISRHGKFQTMVAFFAAVRIPSLVVDRLGRVIFMNKTAEEYWKVRVKDVRGQDAAKVMQLNERDADEMHRRSRGVIFSHEPHAYMEVFGNGKPRRFSVLKIAFDDGDGDVLLGALVLPHLP
jgi:PAS domain-containing protein